VFVEKLFVCVLAQQCAVQQQSQRHLARASGLSVQADLHFSVHGVRGLLEPARTSTLRRWWIAVGGGRLCCGNYAWHQLYTAEDVYSLPRHNFWVVMSRHSLSGCVHDV
jgi:hypothetical protein